MTCPLSNPPHPHPHINIPYHTHTYTHIHPTRPAPPTLQVLMAAHQALERLMDAVPPRTSLDMLAFKLPSDASVASGTDVDGDMLAATIR